MASYKDIIAGTISSVVGKVKEAADNGTFRDIYDKGASRAKTYGNIAKLSLQVAGDSEELKRIYAEIGRLYYEQAKNSPEGFFAPLFAQADEVSKRIVSMQNEIDSLKAQFADSAESDIDVEITQFDDVVSSTENNGRNDD